MPPRWRTGKTPQVCIVGAGVTGLKCADVLLQGGIDVTIFEARDRIGGRVCQSKVSGHLADLGANWIHGTQGNPIAHLANETGTATRNGEEGAAIYDESGALVPAELSDELSEIFWSLVAEAFEYSNHNFSSIPSNQSLRDFVRNRVASMDLTASRKKMVVQIAEMWGAFIGEPYEKQSMKWFFLEEVMDGENLFNASTYKKILERIAKPALSRATLHLSTPVISISTSEPSTGHPQATVVTASGSSAFDAAILTVPLGCLKHATPTISPPIPPHLSMAIRSISYGRLEKVYLTFPSAFWDRPHPSSASSSPHPASPFPFFANFLEPHYAPLNTEARNVQFCSLSALPAGTAHPTLLFYLHGPLAAALGERLAPHALESPARLAAAAEFFRPYYARLPGYDAADPTCEPQAALATAWHRDPWAGYGSYSCFLIPEPGAAEEMRLDEAVVALRRGLPERGLWLAGEHTAPFVALGTVTGAWWSGERVAKRVLTWMEGGEDGGWEEAPKEKGLTPGRSNGTVQVGKGGPDRSASLDA